MSIEPLIEFLTTLPSHDRQTLLATLEVAKPALIMDCEEQRLLDGMMLALWKSVKIEEFTNDTNQ